MSRRDPKRLRLVASSALQRRVLYETAHEEPSPELSHRMARTLGVSAAAIGAVSGAALAKTTAAAAKAVSPAAAGAGVGAATFLPWMTVGVLGLALAGAIVGTQAWKAPVRQLPPPAPGAIASAPEPAAPAAPAPAFATGPASPTPSRPELSAMPSGHRVRTATAPPDMREQTSLVDAARNAVASGAAGRALALLRQYQDQYPGGVFRPEAAALKIEALARLGRGAEVRALADGFVAQYGDGPLTDRVRRIAGLTHP